MKKIFLLIIFGILFCVGCSEKKPEQSTDDKQLSKFIVGKWRAEQQNQDIYGEYHEEYFIKFINKHHLLFCNKRPIESFCSFFTYEQIEEGVFFVKNARMNGGEWFIAKEENDLKICLWDESNCLQFTHDTSGFDFKLEVLGIMK